MAPKSANNLAYEKDVMRLGAKIGAEMRGRMFIRSMMLPKASALDESESYAQLSWILSAAIRRTESKKYKGPIQLSWNGGGYTINGRVKKPALEWLLEEIHMTWVHLEKKQTRLWTYTKSHDDFCKQWLETAYDEGQEKVEETLGTLIEVEPLDETQLEDLGLNTCNHDLPLSSMEVSSFDELEPQPQPLPNRPPLDVSLGNKRGLEPHNPDSFRLKVVGQLTIHIPPSPHVAYYHPSLGDPKKHYGFKPGLLGHGGSLGVDFSKLKMIEDDFFREGLSLPVRPKVVGKVRIKDSHHLEHIF
nr:hypothetical protein [Tanacetum cinerariifolium]